MGGNLKKKKKRLWGIPWWSSGKDSASPAGDTGSTPGQGTKIPYAAWLGQKKKRLCFILLKIFFVYFLQNKNPNFWADLQNNSQSDHLLSLLTPVEHFHQSIQCLIDFGAFHIFNHITVFHGSLAFSTLFLPLKKKNLTILNNKVREILSCKNLTDSLLELNQLLPSFLSTLMYFVGHMESSSLWLTFTLPHLQS